MRDTSELSLTNLSQIITRPSITIGAVVLGLWLGIMRFPFLKYLEPVGEFYISLLQICVLPFLLATIPLAVRSTFASGTAGKVLGRLAIWLITTLVVVMLIAVLVPTVIFNNMPLDQSTTNRIGVLFGVSANGVDIELALNPQLSTVGSATREVGLLSLVPTNIFSALSSNESLKVIIFALFFGVGMVTSERRSGSSIFSALKHIQAVCILIFDWFNVFTPIGIVALMAPQIALIGPDVYAVLAPFAYAYLAASAFLLAMPFLVVSMVLQLDPRIVLAKLLKPLALAAATRNSLVCIPTTLETMKEELHVPNEICELYIPIGFTTMRFGTMALFVIATLFIGYVLGRTFSALELVLVAALSILSSFATLGASGLAALAPMAVVLRAFGLSYELALPLMVIVDPITNIVRTVVNVALNCHIPVLASGWEGTATTPAITPATAPAE
jgi:proton glutamate symport protein